MIYVNQVGPSLSTSFNKCIPHESHEIEYKSMSTWTCYEERLLAPKLQHGQIEEKYYASVNYQFKKKKKLIQNKPREYNAAQLHKNDYQELSIRIKRDLGETLGSWLNSTKPLITII